ncbi:hypothetical protein F4553_001808 [Allocatelliglobosispora scoriae]|uniref:Uncharacterized protein n=1 Tax=Allocatelliglobosispora scoriae TaxID=643052 RepID=A0A841BMM0_9ACTN|nr:hypothetical protein [Allocatelliglobosispora scoriae]MBB5868429.1 hypothetical protein [Allocatelliglobosispora scoriae]
MHTRHRRNHRSVAIRAASLAGAALLLLPLAACVKKASTAQPTATPTTTTDVSPGDTGPSPVPRSSIYAFAGTKAFGVGEAGKVLYQATSGTWSEPQWTQKGRYAAAVSRTLNAKDARLAVIDSQTGKVINIRCGCGSVALVGDSIAVWADEKGQLFQLDITSAGVARKLNVSLPQGTPRLAAAGTNDTFLLIASDAPDGDNGKGAAYSVKLDGSKTLVRDLPEVSTLQFAAARAGGGEGARWAYQVIESQGDCAHPGPILVVDDAGAATTPDVTDLLGGKTAEEVDVAVLSAWWEPDGRLFAVMQSWICDPSGGTPVVKASLWRLDGGKWLAVEQPALRLEHDLAADTKIVLTDDDKLTLETSSGSTPIAADVLSVVLPPVVP